MLLLLGAFVAGILTVLAPCVLPLLPIIIGGSVKTDKKGKPGKPDRLRPVIITISLAISLAVFTLLLKVTTVFINVPPETFSYISGGIIILLGLFVLFPTVYEKIIIKFNLQSRSQRLLGKSFANKSHLVGPIITGAALGPVFSSCSPVYGYILATVLPVNFSQALVYMAAYILGLAVVLLAIGLAGQKAIAKLRWAANPRGWFQRIIAVIFILMGILIITGNNVKLQTWVSTHTPFNIDKLSSKLIPQSSRATEDGKDLNVKEPYAAAEFTGLTDWMNTPGNQPLTLEQLKGKVVLIDFWTYSCINCIRTEPYLKGWYQTYKDDGLVIVGVHAPEFSFERLPANVAKAVQKAGITYPVALDNNLSTWGAYQNQYWPSHYLIDAKGQVRRTHSGEGEYLQMENAIRALLAEKGKVTPNRYLKDASDVPVTSQQTPETYLGANKVVGWAGPGGLTLGERTFNAVQPLPQNKWTLGGRWRVEGQTITSVADSTLTFHMAAKDAYVVAGSATPVKMGVSLNGQPISQTNSAGQDVQNSQVDVGMSQLYRIVSRPQFDKDMTVQLQVPAGVTLNVFTFGS